MLKSASSGNDIMKKTSVDNFVSELEVKLPPHEKFLKLGDFTSLWQDESGNFVRLNYERGPLLYALIAKFKPKNVLEFGTGGGYGTLCMAWAMNDYNIDGKIYTIDRYSQDLSFDRPINYTEEFSPTVEHLSLKELWSKIASTDWLKHIEPLTGYSGEIMSKYKFPKIDFAYIDGHHVFRAVEHDFYAFLNVSSNDFHILFDDYGISDGVTKLIDDDISKNFTCVVIKTNLKQQYQELDLKTIKSDLFPTLVLVSTNFLKNHYNKLYPTHKINDVLKKYRKFEKRWRLRQKINQKLPMLKNISFSKYFRS